MPGDAGMPIIRPSIAARSPVILFSEAVSNHFADSVDRGVSVIAFGTNGHERAVLRREHHYDHDTLCVDLEVVTHNDDVALEFRRGLDDLRRWTSMYSLLVHNLRAAFSH
jgi:hypothetical protein